MSLSALSDQPSALTRRNGAVGDIPGQIAQDFLVDQFKVIQFCQLTKITIAKICFQIQHVCTLARMLFKGWLVANAVFPAFQKDQSFRIQADLIVTICPHGIAGFEQFNHEVPWRWCF